jgi:hypothetical protein
MWGTATAVSPDGGTVFVTGVGSKSGDTGFGQTVAYSAATGTVAWKARFNFDAGTDDNGFTSIAVSPSGSTVFVTGYSTAWLTIGYSTASGAAVFRAGYDQRAEKYAYGLAVSRMAPRSSSPGRATRALPSTTS